MRTADIFRLSLINALRGRIRTVLTMVAIAIGVAATILVIAIGSSARFAVSEQLDNIGISGIAIYPKKTASDVIELTDEDAAEVMAQVDGIISAMPVVIKYGAYAMKNWQGNALIYGVNEQLGNALNLNLLYGRLPTAGDVRRGNQVAVIDSELAKLVYSRENIVGKMINLKVDGSEREFEIIGIISSQSVGISSLIGEALPTFVYIPNSALSKFSSTIPTAEQLLVTTDDDDAIEQAIELLNRKYKIANAFKYEDISGFRTQIDSAMLAVSLFIAAVGAISMVVAGIGIMNSMLSTAIERRREVGVYMSLGARRRDIMFGFLAEAGIISAVGGIGGIAIGFAVIKLFETLSEFTVVIDIPVILAIETAAIFCGVLFGVLPAVRASRLDPIEALRD